MLGIISSQKQDSGGGGSIVDGIPYHGGFMFSCVPDCDGKIKIQALPEKYNYDYDVYVDGILSYQNQTSDVIINISQLTRIEITGDFPYFRNFQDKNECPPREGFVKVYRFGNIEWMSMGVEFSDIPPLGAIEGGMFQEAINLVFDINIDIPNLSNVTNMSYMFFNAQTFNQDIGNWNTENVTDMSNMFDNAQTFNQDIGNWNTQNVTSMDEMFYSAQTFNQNLSSWCVSQIANKPSSFDNNSAFQNQTALQPQWGQPC